MDRHYLTNGLQFYSQNSAVTSTSVSRNDFEYNTYGLIAAPDVYPITASGTTGTQNTSTNTINLSISCNKFLHNLFGIIGSGGLIDQGTSTNDAENNFNSAYWTTISTALLTHINTNSIADFFWVGNSGSPVNYYYADHINVNFGPPGSSVTPPNFATTTSISGIDINYGPYTHSSFLIPTGIYSTDACFAQWKRGYTAINNKAKVGNLVVYPNPFFSGFTIDLSSIDQSLLYNLEIWDMLGRKMKSYSFENRQTFEIDAATWMPGAYNIRLYSAIGIIYNEHIVKQ